MHSRPFCAKINPATAARAQKEERAHAQTAERLSVRRPLKQLFRGGGGKLHLPAGAGEAAKIVKGDRPSLRIGYLRCYTGAEFQRALALFPEKHPDVEVSVICGSHEELYGLLRTGDADLVLNDQRRAFSDEYVNLLLTTCRSYIEVSARSYCAGWKKDNSGYYVEEFAELLKTQFAQ